MINRNQRKREFLKWLLNNYHHENPSVDYLLNYLMTQPDIISIISFSDKVKDTPRGIYISFQNNDKQSFVYYKDHLKYTSSDQAFHDLRFSHRFADDVFYIEVDIPDMYQKLYYFDVFDENPYKKNQANDLNEELDNKLNEISHSTGIKMLKQEIDRALDNNQFEKVEYYLTQLEKLRGKNNES